MFEEGAEDKLGHPAATGRPPGILAWVCPLSPWPPAKTAHTGYSWEPGETAGICDLVAEMIEDWFHKVQTTTLQVNSIPDFLVSFLGCGPETPKISNRRRPFLGEEWGT